MSRIFLGRAEHWGVLAACGLVLYGMGTRHLHVRAFVPFSLTLLAVVALGLSWIVWRYRPGEAVTRESLEGLPLPGGGGEPEVEVVTRGDGAGPR